MRPMSVITTLAKHTLLYAFVFLVCRLPVNAQQDSLSGNLSVPAHPRLLMTTADEQAINENIKSNKTWKTVQEAILRQCDSLLTLQPSTRDMTGIRLDTYRYCLYRIFFLSYAWRTTHEKKYFNQAERELLAVSGFSDWNPSHYLDV